MTDRHKNPNGLEALHERLKAIVEREQQIRLDVNDLYSKFNLIGRTNWQVIISALGVAFTIMGGVLWLYVNPIIVSVDKIQWQIRDLKAEIDADVARLVRKDVLEARRAEINALFGTYQQRIDNQAYRLDVLYGDFKSIAPPTKYLEWLAQRIERLEGEAFKGNGVRK